MHSQDTLHRIEKSLDRLSEEMTSVKERLAAIETDLRHHIKRSDALETEVDELKKFMWKALGALAVAGPIVSLLLKYLVK